MVSSAFKNSERIAPDFFSDRGFVYADGFFETMRVTNSSIPLLDCHIERAMETARRLKISLSESDLKLHIKHCLDSIDKSLSLSAVHKLIVSRGEGGRAAYPPAENDQQVNIYSTFQAYKPAPRSDVDLKLVNETLPTYSKFAGLKLINRMEYTVAVQAMSFDYDQEALFLNERQKLVETMHHNVFFFIGDVLHTPDLSGFGVNGVLRRFMISTVAKKMGLIVEQGEYGIEQLCEGDGAFLTNAVEGLVPVRSVNGIDIRDNPIIDELNTYIERLRHP